MNGPDWNIIVSVAGVAVSFMLPLGSWMFMVHAKLAVIAARLNDLAEKVEHAAESNSDLWRQVADHATRLKTHDVQLTHMAERLEQMS